MLRFRVEGIKPGMPLSAFTDPPGDPASCAANGQGWMSPRQRSGVVRRTVGCLFWLFILVACVVSGAVPGLGVMVGGFWPLGVVLLGLAVYVLLSFTLISGAGQQLCDGRGAFMDGFGERESKESSDSETGGTTTSSYYVLYQQQPSGVNHQRFSVSGAAYYALVPGLRYRVYYLPSDHKLLSIEALP